MKKLLYFVPAVLAMLLYAALGFMGGFGAIDPWVWFWIGILFLSALVLARNKWYGCVGGLAAGCLLLFMSTRYTGQVVSLERPLGILLCIYFLVCGIAVYRKTQR